MQVGVVGLGRMGGGIVRRLVRAGHRCVVFDRNPEPGRALAGDRVVLAETLPELVALLEPPRAVWLMLPAGPVTEEAVGQAGGLLAPGDLLVDGGNSHFKDDIRRAHALAAKGIGYLDVGTSGGVWGLERGFCLMIGGEDAAVRRLDPVFAALAPGAAAATPTAGRTGRDPRVDQGYLHCGPSGSGHFVKMIHNGIEYGLMQAYAEGFDILKNAGAEHLPADQRYALDLGDIAEVWRRGSVVGSWLLDLTAAALAADGALQGYTGHVEDSGEGRWTVQAAIEEAVPADVLSAALYTRFRSRQDHTFAEKLLSAMRAQFGGHREPGAPTGGSTG